jgi:hypothetical protein
VLVAQKLKLNFDQHQRRDRGSGDILIVFNAGTTQVIA